MLPKESGAVKSDERGGQLKLLFLASVILCLAACNVALFIETTFVDYFPQMAAVNFPT